MSEHVESIDGFVERESFALAKVARDYYDALKAGREYLPAGALKAKAKRYLELSSKEKLTREELREYGSMFALFSVMYDDACDPAPAALAVDFCNLLASKGVVLV